MNPIPTFQSELRLIQTEFSIRMNSNESEVGMIRTNSNWKFGLDQSELGLSRTENLVRNDSHWLGYRYRNESEEF